MFSSIKDFQRETEMLRYDSTFSLVQFVVLNTLSVIDKLTFSTSPIYQACKKKINDSYLYHVKEIH